MELTPNNLDQLSGIAQCLDDQCAPPDIAQEAAESEKPLSDYAKRIQPAMKMEFFKALLTLRSVVVNRAYLLHNEAVKELYLGGDSEAESFERLVQERAIIPFLYDERQLSDFKGTDLSRDVEDYWVKAEAKGTNKLRLSWDDKRNGTLITDHISKRFGGFFKTIDDLRPDLLRNDFSLSTFDDESIRQMLKNMRDFANRVQDETGRPVKRKEIYHEFVCVGGLHKDHLVFDLKKPLAMQIKALADLKYNVNLPDVLNRYVVTSQGSTSRECLQEIKELTEGIKEVDEKELQDLMMAVAGVGLDIASKAVQLTDIGSVSLDDIVAVRNDPIWALHHQIAVENLPDNKRPMSEQKFVQDPLESIRRVSGSLGNVVERLGQIQRDSRLREATERWEVRLSALGIFEMVASEAGHAFGLPHLPEDPVSEHSLSRGMVPLVAHAVVYLEGGGLKYEIKQPVFQGKIWAETAAKIAREVRSRLSFEGTEIAPTGDQLRPDQQGGGLEVKDRDD
ncbi:hypothetical protein WN73_40220 [Bradyrhizobium sp. CCBAU 45394]|nr:hypothetical protein [Bradyrhizobium sp. CCBAU 45394]